MVSSYALPSSALPHAHHQHMHSNSHSSSGSPAPLNAWKSSISSSSLQPNSHNTDPSDKDPQHGHNHSGHSHAANSNAPRPRMPPPPSLSSLSGWKSESTAGGRTIITTPATATFSPLYPPPDLSQDGSGHHHQSRRHAPQLGASHGHDDSHTHEHGHHHSHVHDIASIDGHGAKHHAQRDRDTSHDAESSAGASVFTRLLLPYTAKWPSLHSIMTEKDSRRIFYFMTLNFSFMVVQAFYGYLTDSLGLLSDSIHMFFDCVALLVGLFAAVASKWPSNRRFPYGFGKIETLSGLLSVEITFEAFERLWEGTKTKRLTELFIVSTLGLLVNLVGMMAFGHHHHGHSHGHSHGHGHGHDHEHEHDHGHHNHQHGHGHSQDGGCGHSHDDHAASHGHAHGHAHGHSHGHSHDNENMQGIYLHVLADTLGSASVIVSTLLTHFTGWAGWDPLASCLIAGLIALSARPLVVSAASRLLLGVPDDVEYTLRNTLAGIAQQRGVAGYAAPKFWVDDRAAAGGGNDGLLGVVHVIVARGAGLDDVRDRVRAYLSQHGVDVVVQVEREGDSSCWCGGGRGASSAVQVSGAGMGTGPVPIPGRGAGGTLKVL